MCIRDSSTTEQASAHQNTMNQFNLYKQMAKFSKFIIITENVKVATQDGQSQLKHLIEKQATDHGLNIITLQESKT